MSDELSSIFRHLGQKTSGQDAMHKLTYGRSDGRNARRWSRTSHLNIKPAKLRNAYSWCIRRICTTGDYRGTVL
jgi:hypothetical protein